MEILQDDADTPYLGRALTMNAYYEHEFRNRINKAWKKFAVHKKTLCDKHGALKHRLRLFAATVTPTVLYGSCAWTMTQEMESELQGLQRQMLRKMLGSPRKLLQVSHTSSLQESDSEVQSDSQEAEPEFQLEDWVSVSIV